jgi:hypothetical protein
MDHDKFSSELQTWMQESGAVKELRTRLRKEMYDLLLTKKLSKETKNINIENDKNGKINNVSDRAINLLIVEHLMKKGMWYTASVMVSEAEFLEEPPEIEIVTTTKKSSNSDKMLEYKRQSPSKLSDETIDKVLNGVFNFDYQEILESVLLSYYRQKDASVMSLLFKFVSDALQKVDPKPAKLSDQISEKIVRNVEKKKRKEKKKDSSTSVSADDYSMEERRVSTTKRRSVDLSNDERDLLKKLQKQLLDARCEIEVLAETKVRLAHFQSVSETQKFSLEELRREVNNLKSQQNVMNDKITETKIIDTNLVDNLQAFVAQVKSSVDNLELASQNIDSEFAALS